MRSSKSKSKESASSSSHNDLTIVTFVKTFYRIMPWCLVVLLLTGVVRCFYEIRLEAKKDWMELKILLQSTSVASPEDREHNRSVFLILNNHQYSKRQKSIYSFFLNQVIQEDQSGARWNERIEDFMAEYRKSASTP